MYVRIAFGSSDYRHRGNSKRRARFNRVNHHRARIAAYAMTR